MNTNTTPDTALTPLLEKATGGGDWSHYGDSSGAYLMAHTNFGETIASNLSDDDAALITASVRSIRWAHSEAGLEAIAREACRFLHEYGEGEACVMDESPSRPPCTAESCGRMRLARSIVAALAKAGVGE